MPNKGPLVGIWTFHWWRFCKIKFGFENFSKSHIWNFSLFTPYFPFGGISQIFSYNTNLPRCHLIFKWHFFQRKMNFHKFHFKIFWCPKVFGCTIQNDFYFQWNIITSRGSTDRLGAMFGFYFNILLKQGDCHHYNSKAAKRIFQILLLTSKISPLDTLDYNSRLLQFCNSH